MYVLKYFGFVSGSDETSEEGLSSNEMFSFSLDGEWPTVK